MTAHTDLRIAPGETSGAMALTSDDIAAVLAKRTAPTPQPKRRQRGRFFGPLMFLLLVVVPTVAMMAYAAYTPAPIFASEASFAVRARDGKTSVTGFGNIAASLGIGLSGVNDSYAVRNYLQSPDALAAVEAMAGFRKHMRDQPDPFLRLRDDTNTDAVYAYYQQMVQIRLSTIEQILTIEARAFSPEISNEIASTLLKAAERFVNQMNERAHQDYLRFAQDVVKKAEQRVTDARLAINRWRNENASIDPLRQGEMVQTIIGGLEGELAKVRAELLEVTSNRLAPSFQPRIRSLRTKEESLAAQIEQERKRLTGRDTAVSNLLVEYEHLQVEKDLSEKGYTSAVESLEAARQEANQQHKYVVVIQSPTMPRERLFPRPIMHGGGVFLAGLILFILVMVLRGVWRDYHA